MIKQYPNFAIDKGHWPPSPDLTMVQGRRAAGFCPQITRSTRIRKRVCSLCLAAVGFVSTFVWLIFDIWGTVTEVALPI